MTRCLTQTENVATLDWLGGRDEAGVPEEQPPRAADWDTDSHFGSRWEDSWDAAPWGNGAANGWMNWNQSGWYSGWGASATGAAMRSSGYSQEADGRGEYIPEFDGKNYRAYVRKVQIWLCNSRMPPERRAGRLLERLKDAAFEATETLSPTDLQVDDGVNIHLNHLRDRFEPLEVLRTGRIVDDFLYDFER